MRPLELLQRAHRNSQPLVLGLSGGPDSMALFEFLLHYQGMRPFELHVAHVDHGWRKESAKEAEFLKELCARHHCPFHLKRLRAAACSDIENSARSERLIFFEEIVKKTGAQALCLAHHSDDLAETVLKRIFETAPLERIGAFSFESRIGDLVIWRPLIHLSKGEIAAFGFDDATNRDRRFLRARLRQDLIPEIERHFGKGVRSALVRLSKRSHKLDAYLEKRCLAWLGEKKLPLGIDFTGAEVFEIEYVLSRRADLPANLREELSEELASLAANRFFDLGRKKIVVHKGSLLIAESFELTGERNGSFDIARPWFKLWTEGGSWPIEEVKALPAPLRPYIDFRAKIV